jgi:hypothetical protein
VRVYSQSTCGIDGSLLDKLVRAAAALRQHIVDKEWQADFADYDAHQAEAEKCLTRGDLVGAFREYCRSMRPLSEALQKQRNKEEVFQPVWDRPTSGPGGPESNGNRKAWYQCVVCNKTFSATPREPGPSCCGKEMRKIR